MISVSAVGGADQITIPNQPESFGGGFVIIPGLSQAAFDSGSRYAAAVVGLGYTNTLGSEVIDINNDGLLDVVLCNNGGGFVNGAISIYINQGTPNLSDPNNEILTTFANFGNVPNPSFPVQSYGREVGGPQWRWLYRSHCERRKSARLGLPLNCDLQRKGLRR